ncbi:MAG TPA: hypothetical protein VFV93_12170 [Thermomicrobiales bacterium]|nr:hypothetical protein [Thermomicrobiales bacterium]
MRYLPTIRTVVRLAAAALVATWLAAGIGAGVANADDDVGAPEVQGLRLEAPVAYVTFKDNASGETSFLIILSERNDPNRVSAVWSTGGVPGVGRVATRQVDGIRPGVAYCVVVQAFRSADGLEVLTDLSGLPGTGHSRESNAVCTDPDVRPPDLAMERIGGREERDWATVAGQAPAYLVAFRNDGADARGTVTVDIATSGVASLGDQIAVARQGWEAAGFTCASRRTTGAETAALRCTGGSLKQGERVNSAVIVRFTGPGYGYIHASISVSDGPVETDTSDNLAVLGVRVY